MTTDGRSVAAVPHRGVRPTRTATLRGPDVSGTDISSDSKDR